MIENNNNNSKISVKEWRKSLTQDIQNLTESGKKDHETLIRVDLNLTNHLTKHEKAEGLEADYNNKLKIIRKNHRYQLILAVLAPILGGIVTYLIIKSVGG